MSSSGIEQNSLRWTEGYKEKAIRKTKENPWVPLGTLITTGALTMAAIRLRQGNSRKFQIWLRYRVAFQALTIFAVLGGLYKYGQANLEENQRVMEQINQQRAAREMERERGELEERIREAERVMEEEKAVTPVRRPMGGGFGSESVESSSQAAPTSQSPSSSSSSWWNVFGWGSSNSK
ncbi:hypoxia induced protein conserved region-domain-containing protein [Lentinula raphanica]|uniref:Hypoxia induced protein conserved region-domain-containing protein n=1 Tax=Lentinula raphanica TaxID=153919 RepID=A0AA38P671_9AGAR|nr:hypoxia induced protein conserved region-domain-containing protein [Lentinula raphanica]